MLMKGVHKPSTSHTSHLLTCSISDLSNDHPLIVPIASCPNHGRGVQVNHQCSKASLLTVWEPIQAKQLVNLLLILLSCASKPTQIPSLVYSLTGSPKVSGTRKGLLK